MSDIKKNERKESKLQTIHNAYMIRQAVTNLAENNFYITFSKIEDRINNKEIIEIGILLKHIIRNAIPKEQFNIEKEVEKIKSFNNYDEEITKIFKTRLYRIIEKYYIRNSFFRTLKYKVNRDRIIKDFIYKVLENIEKDIQKNTNNQLVFKEFFGIII